MTAREHTDTTSGERLVTYRGPSSIRMFALLLALVAGLAIALGAMISAAQAAPVGMLKQYRVPTAGSSPMHMTQATDGNFWFTEPS